MKARRGVTLMELIVALTVTGFMAAIGTATFSSIIDNKRIVREATGATERSAALRETLRGWLLPATIQIQLGGVPRGATSANVRLSAGSATTRTPNGAESVSAAAISGDELIFNTTAPNPANAPNARMRLFIDEDDETPEHGLTLEFQVNQQSPLQRRQLDSTITELTIEYLDARNGRWVAAANMAGVRAKALRLSLIAAEGENVPALMALPMTFYMNSFATTTVSRTPTR